MSFVFIQTGTDTNVPRESIPGLMVRHLQYIATRPGAVFNPECGFSLWGGLSPFAPAENLESLEDAKQLVRAEAERGRTMYRAVISLGEPEASERGYYDRAKWEPLAKSQINEIAKGLHIQPENLRWMAAMHCEPGHPHIHMIYWDAGMEPRQEYMPPKQFTTYAEHIRASLNRFEFGAEIQESQTWQKEEGKLLRLELQELCMECNPAGTLHVKKLYGSEQLTAVAEKLDGLVRDMPARGSLKYAYLPPGYKAQVNALISEIKALPQFQKKLGQYMAATDRISELYGNGKETMAANRKKAMSNLDRSLGNEITNAVQSIRREMEADAPQLPEELSSFAREAAELLRDTDEYRALQQMLPKDRIPVRQMNALPGFQAAKDAALNSLLQDARVRVRLNAYAKRADAEEPGHAAYKKAYSDFFRAAGRELNSMLREDAGYAEEARQTDTVHTLYRLFRLLSQMTGQRQTSAQLSAKRALSRDRSREARMDRAQQALQSEDWTPSL